MEEDALREDIEQAMLDYVGMVYQVALRLTGDLDAAEYLTGSTIRDALDHYEGSDPGIPLKGWLLTTLRKTFIREFGVVELAAAVS